MRWATVMLALVVVLVAAPAWADFQAGLEAYLRGDYATALTEFRPLAQQGHAKAQFGLGLMYSQGGRGVPQDDAKALRWYRRAAEQGHAGAKFNLGFMYSKGRGGPLDYVQAHMWVNLAAAQGDENARKARDKLAEQMAPAQITEAQRLAREWKPDSDEPGSTKAKEVQGDD